MEGLDARPRSVGVEVRVEWVTKSFGSRRGGVTAALDGVSFTVGAGELLTLLGPSGCGKSTVIDMVAGLQDPDSGRITVGNDLVHGPAPDRTVVFQQYALMPWMTVLRNVTLPLEALKVTRTEREFRARQLLEVMGLSEFEHHYPRQLSGGMKQRVALARALVVEPRLLLMDEPFAALDAQTRQLLQDELIRIWEATRRTIIFVTHSLDEALYLSNRIILMSARPGRVKCEFEVPRARPRHALDEEDGFAAERLHLRQRIWGLLRQEISAAGTPS
jgi:NitT/TauT family transport system ATP-binding protein